MARPVLEIYDGFLCLHEKDIYLSWATKWDFIWALNNHELTYSNNITYNSLKKQFLKFEHVSKTKCWDFLVLWSPWYSTLCTQHCLMSSFAFSHHHLLSLFLLPTYFICWEFTRLKSFWWKKFGQDTMDSGIILFNLNRSG